MYLCIFGISGSLINRGFQRVLVGNVKFTDGNVSNEFPPYYGVGKIELNHILPIAAVSSFKIHAVIVATFVSVSDILTGALAARLDAAF